MRKSELCRGSRIFPHIHSASVKLLLHHAVSRGEKRCLHVSGVSGSRRSNDSSRIHPLRVPSAAMNWKNFPGYCFSWMKMFPPHVQVGQEQ